jgi:hypothetical protein
VATKKSLIGIFMILALLALQVQAAYAAPAAQATSVDGTVQSITQSTDTSGNVIFIVTILDTSGKTQTLRISAATALSLGLVTFDGTNYTVSSTAVGSTVSIPTGDIIANPCDSTEGNIVAKALAAFFCQGGSTVLDNSVDGLHTEGFGFGEIAQACFMAEVLNSTCGDILNAKKSHDFSALGLPSDVTVSNWGQLKKYVLADELHSLTNLGAIMSGRATAPAPVPGETPTPTPTPGGAAFPNGNGNGHGQGGGNGNGNGHGNGNGNGHGHQP